MANISSIKLPNGITYNLKDNISGYTTNTGTITSVKTTAGAHTTINVSSGAAAFNVPTKTSHLTNDSGFLTSGNITETTATLTTSGWSSKQQSVTVSGVTTSNKIIVSAAPASFTDYSTCGVYCSAQASNSLTFKCNELPAAALTVNILIINS